MRNAARHAIAMIICLLFCTARGRCVYLWYSAFVVCCKIYAQRLHTRRGRSLYLYLWRVFCFRRRVASRPFCILFLFLACVFSFLSLFVFSSFRLFVFCILFCPVFLFTTSPLLFPVPCFFLSCFYIFPFLCLFPFPFLSFCPFVFFLSFPLVDYLICKYTINNKYNIYLLYHLCARICVRARARVTR